MQEQICTCLSKKQILTTLKIFWYLELTHFWRNCQMLINSPGLLSRAEHSSSLSLGTQQGHPQWPWQTWLWLWALSPGLLLAAACSLLGKGASKSQLSLIPQLWSKDTEAPKSRSPPFAVTNLPPWGAQPPAEEQAQPGWHGWAARLWPSLLRELLNCETEPCL